MNVLTNPLLFADLQGATPPVWWTGSAFLFPGSSGTSKGIIYTGAPFKLPASLTFSVLTGAGASPPTLVATTTSPTLGDQITSYNLSASTNITRTLALPSDVTALRFDDMLAGVPYVGAVSVTLTPISAVDRTFPTNNMGRVSTAYVSGYDRDRVHVTSLYANEIRPLTANFNGALQAGRVLASATWQTWQTSSVQLGAATITDKTTSIEITCGYAGASVVKCTAVLDNGEKLVQQFRLDVSPQPYYTGDTYPINGPQSVTVSA